VIWRSLLKINNRFLEGGISMKKFIAVLLSSVMIFGSFNAVFAGNPIPAQLEQTILSVKGRIKIPEEFSEFEYSVNDFNQNNKYELHWSKKNTDTEKGRDNIYVEIDTAGNIYSYRNYNSENSAASFNDKKSYDECIEASEDFIKKVIPEDYSEFKPMGGSDGDRFFFVRYKGDVPVRFNTIQVRVNRATLEVLEYSFPKADYLRKSFTDKEVISPEEASDTIIDSVIEPEYRFVYDYKTKEKNVFLVYNPDRFERKSVDAKTGDVIERSDSGFGYYTSRSIKADSADSGIGGEEEIRLTEEEIAEIEKTRSLLSKEEADAEIKKLIPDVLKLKGIEKTRLSKDRVDTDKYIWYITYGNGSAAIDAKNKKLIYCNGRFNNFEPGGVSDEDAVYESRKVKAEEYLRKVASDKLGFAEFSREESTTNNLVYVRQVNGVDFPQNTIRVGFNNRGDVVSYHCDWYDSLEFPNAENLIGSKKVFEQLKETSEFGLCYEIKYNKKNLTDIVLAYSFIESDNFAPYIDAKTGKELDYKGEEYDRILSAPASYPDIKGHPCEKYVNILLNNGIYVKRDMFLPDEKITKSDFSGFCDGLDREMSEAFKGSEEFITRKEMCGIISDILEYDKITVKDIFKNPFKDVKDNDDGLGDMAVANALGILTADGDGNFYPDREITNAEAAMIIYNLEEFYDGEENPPVVKDYDFMT